MTEQQRGGAFFLVFFITLILAANVAGASVDGGSQEAASSEGKIPELAAGPKSSVTTPASSPKAVEKNRKLFSDEEVEEPIVPGDDEGEEENGENGEDEEYEGETEADEYAEELRAAAESHEAMSRNDKQSTNKTDPQNDRSLPNGESSDRKLHDSAKKDFDSREKSVESGSDESESSNETVVEGSEDPEDEEVSELVKYKSTNHYFKTRDESTKRKRVPTVKKELSTQTEIKTSNVSKPEKRFSTKEMLDELNKQFKHSIGYTENPPPCDDKTSSVANGGSDKIEDVLEEAEVDDYLDRNSAPTDHKLQTNSKLEDLESEELDEPGKLDKRQEAVLRDLEAYLRAEYAAEQEQQQKLQELGAQEGALAESLLELLVKLAENPRRWERVHRLLMDVEGGLELSRQALEARKRAFNLTSVVATTTTTSPVSNATKKPRKKPKKKKKKKKKQRHHRFSSTTTTSIPTTLPLLTTTEAPWLTTPMQWRLVAERLFGPPWPQDLQDDPGLAKVRFTVPSNSRTSPPSREFVEQLGDSSSKQSQDHKALNTERQALMLETSREYTQPRHLHYGKVNTHQGVKSQREPSSVSNGYHASNRDTVARVRDYDPPERTPDYDVPRYGQFDYPRARVQGEDFFPVQSYAQNHEYRPPSREYAASKSWHDSQYKYGRPSWKSDDPSPKWAWPQLDDGPKTGWHRAQNDREYWPNPWPQTQRGASSGWERVGEPDSWAKTSWPGPENSKGQYAREEVSSPPWEAKGRTESTKMSIKGWGAVPEDQGSPWPFSLTAAKPWPKDNGPSPGVVGLAKDSTGKNTPKYKPGGIKGAKNKPQKALEDENRQQIEQITRMGSSWNSDMDTNPKIWPPKTAMSPKIQSVGAWVMPVDQSTWKPYKLKPVQETYPENNHEDDSNGRHRWNVQMDTNPRTWPPKAGDRDDQWNKFSKPSTGVTWPKWKQFAYHRVTAMPILSQGAGSLQDGTRARNNAYIAVSAVSPKYNGNQWRKNDIEETPVGQGGAGGAANVLPDSEHPVSQLRANVQTPAIYTWKKKDGSGKPGQNGNRNSTDPLEEQLETLRRGASWSHNENRDNIKKQLNVISDASETLASRYSSNTSSDKPEETGTTATAKENLKNGEIDQERKITHK